MSVGAFPTRDANTKDFRGSIVTLLKLTLREGRWEREDLFEKDLPDFYVRVHHPCIDRYVQPKGEFL